MVAIAVAACTVVTSFVVFTFLMFFISLVMQVFSWGSSTHGQLGLGDTLKRTRPVQIPSLSNVSLVSIECGQYHCIALDEEHRSVCPTTSSMDTLVQWLIH